jgi:acetoin utilization deacetylase AcuC-like enzyme
VLIGIEKDMDANAVEYDGDLVRLYKRVQKLLNLEPDRKDISDSLKQILSGLTSIVNGLATMRNKMSDAHAATYRPSRHHAKLAVYSATTLADFLFETRNYQQQRGALKAKP